MNEFRDMFCFRVWLCLDGKPLSVKMCDHDTRSQLTLEPTHNLMRDWTTLAGSVHKFLQFSTSVYLSDKDLKAACILIAHLRNYSVLGPETKIKINFHRM